jgi:hypothetical protein
MSRTLRTALYCQDRKVSIRFSVQDTYHRACRTQQIGQGNDNKDRTVEAKGLRTKMLGQDSRDIKALAGQLVQDRQRRESGYRMVQAGQEERTE